MRLALLRAFGGPSLHRDTPALLVRVELDGADAGIVQPDVDAWLGTATGTDGAFPPAAQAVFGSVVALAERAGLDVSSAELMEGPQAGCYDLLLPRDPEPALRHLAGAAVEAINALALGTSPADAEALASEARALAEAHEFGPSTRAIIEAAEKRGIPWERLDQSSLVRLGWGCNARLIRASTTGQTGAVAVDAACDKPLATRLLAAALLPVPRGEIVSTAEDAVAAAERIGYPVVVKPRDGNHGRGVSVGLCSPESVTAAFEIVRELGRRALVEQQFTGRDYRVLVVGGRVVAAAERRPARVVGDGRSTIAELVDRENADPRRGEGHERPMTRIRLDDVALADLAAGGWTPDSVPPPDEAVEICRTANLSRGATAHDVTDDLHPSVRSVCERAARAIGLDVCGVDLVAPSVDAPLPAGSGIVEVNAAPGLRMHVFPAEGTPRDVGGAIVDRLFPDQAPARIPIVAITGTNGKTTTTRLIAHGLAAEGLRVGMTSTDGVWIGGELVARGDLTGPNSARVVLSDPTVEAAVLETARGGIVRRGLAFDLADVAVITNVTEDHLGQDGIRSIDDLYRVKRRLAELVRRGGWLVLNADDERLARLPADPAVARVPRHVCFFSGIADSPIIRHHRAHGGRAIFAHAGWVVEAAGEREVPLFRYDDAPLTMGGQARFQVANLLAAAAALRVRGVAADVVAAAMRSFKPSADNAGRANLYRVGEGYVMLDYGHNPAGYGQICQLAARWRRAGRQVVGVIAAPGDRPDDTIRNSARVAAAGFSRIVIREDEDRRGRAPGEVARLLHDAVREAAPHVPCEIVSDGAQALAGEMPAVRRGAIAIVFYEKLEPLIHLLEDAGAASVDNVEVRPARNGWVPRSGERLRLSAAPPPRSDGQRDERLERAEVPVPIPEAVEAGVRLRGLSDSGDL